MQRSVRYVAGSFVYINHSAFHHNAKNNQMNADTTLEGYKIYKLNADYSFLFQPSSKISNAENWKLFTHQVKRKIDV